MSQEDLLHKTFLLRWNPKNSDMTIEDYEGKLDHFDEWITLTWAVTDYKEVETGDVCYLMMEGEQPGIVASGTVVELPVEGDQKSSDGSKCHYVKFVLDTMCPLDDECYLSLDELEEALPDYDWKEGKSGVCLPEEIGEDLQEIYEDFAIENMDVVLGSENLLPEYDYVGHLECVVDDVDENEEKLKQYLQQDSSKVEDLEGWEDLDGSAFNIVSIDSGEEELSLRGLFYVSDDFNDMMSLYPHAHKGGEVELKLIDIKMLGDEYEAVITGEHASGEVFSFLDSKFYRNGDFYEIDKTYTFRLSAFAYYAEVVPVDERIIEFTEEDIAYMREAFPNSSDEDLTTFDTCEMVGLLQTDVRYPDDGDLVSPVMGEVRQVSLLDKTLYAIPVSILRDEDSNVDVVVPLYVKSEMFKQKPAVGDPIRGMIWLEGELAHDQFVEGLDNEEDGKLAN